MGPWARFAALILGARGPVQRDGRPRPSRSRSGRMKRAEARGPAAQAPAAGGCGEDQITQTGAVVPSGGIWRRTRREKKTNENKKKTGSWHDRLITHQPAAARRSPMRCPAQHQTCQPAPSSVMPGLLLPEEWAVPSAPSTLLPLLGPASEARGWFLMRQSYLILR